MKLFFSRDNKKAETKGGHLRLVHPDTDAVAGHARLRHLEERSPDAVPVADAHLVVGQPLDGEVLAELPEREARAVERFLPEAVRGELVDQHRALLAPVATQVALPVAVDVEAPDPARAGDGRDRTPDTGDGISTSALSVRTSTSGSSSLIDCPSFTSQRTISPSATPSPMSGSLSSWVTGRPPPIFSIPPRRGAPREPRPRPACRAFPARTETACRIR